MPPTVQTSNAGTDRDHKLRPGEKRSDFVCRVKYCNTLLDIPFDSKSVTCPFPSNRFADYKTTFFERNYKHNLLTEHDLGVTIDLINPDAYAIDPTATLHPDDERLLEEDTLTPQDSKRSRDHNKAVPWLKKTEYISNEFNRYGQLSEKTETKVGYNVKKLCKEKNLYTDRESQITAINKTFSDAKISITEHYSKPNVHAVDTYPVFPDFQHWRYPFAQVIFDAEPVSNTMTEEMSQAMIRGVMDEKGEQFVAYFLPTAETMKKRKRDTEYEDEDYYEYKMAREYNWNVKNKASKAYEENYFFVFRDNKVFYNELETRVRLNKRRLKPGAQPNPNSKLVVRHRPLNEVEFKTQELRILQLEAKQEEEEEEEMQVTEENEAEAENESEGNEAEEDNEVEEDNKEKRESSASSESKGEAEEDKSKKTEESDAEEEKQTENQQAASSSSSKSSSSSSSSESEAEADDQNKRDQEEIFGSDSD